MKIGELSDRSGLSIDTLRYYEKIGLIAPPWRNGGKTRIYDPQTLGWITFLKALKATGMPLSTMQTYARLRAEGPATAQARREMLEAQRLEVLLRIDELNHCLGVLDFKIENYLEIERNNEQALRPRLPQPTHKG